MDLSVLTTVYVECSRYTEGSGQKQETALLPTSSVSCFRPQVMGESVCHEQMFIEESSEFPFEVPGGVGSYLTCLPIPEIKFGKALCHFRRKT